MTEKVKALKVLDQQGKEKEEIILNEALFGAPVNHRLLQLVLTAYAGNQRKGLADTKTRREIRGGGKKPWRQKGTGNARQGSIRAPQWRGGGTIFGPTPRSYRTELPDGMKRQAMISALSLKHKGNHVWVLDKLNLSKGKTKELCQVLKNIKLADSKALFVGVQPDENLKRASRNIRHSFKIQNANNLNAYEIMRRKDLVIEKEALPILEKKILTKK